MASHAPPTRHAPTPSFSSAHSHAASFSSAFSTIPPVPPPPPTSQHAHSNSLSSSHAHTQSIGHGHSPSPSLVYASSLGHGHSMSIGHTAPPLTPIKELASARSSPARPPTAAAVREAEESGAPTSGMYARNGFWDSDSDDNVEKGGTSWRARLSGSTSSNTGDRRSVKSTKSSKTTVSSGGRSRSNTLSAQGFGTGTGPSPTIESGPWPWARKNSQPPPTAPTMTACATLPNHGRVPSMAESAAGSRPPSAQQRPPSAAQLFPGVLPSPSMTFPSPASTSFHTPSTFSSPSLPSHPALPEVPKLKQRKSRLRLRSKTARQNEAVDTQDLKTPVARVPLSPVANVGNIQVTAYPSTKGGRPPTPTDKGADGKNKSAWKRGMERLWRSKSAGNMREQYRADQENLPPVPSLPREHAHENVRARLVSQTSAAPPIPTSRPMSPALLPATSLVTSPLSPPLALSPDLSSTSALHLPNITGSAALSRPPTHRSDIDDSILTQLDHKYPSYRARSPHPAMVHADEMENDPFASAIDYSQPNRPRRPSRSPLPAEFGALPSPPPLPEVELGTPRNSPSLTNLKHSLVPRLRKSKSMGLTRRPSSILSAFRGEGSGSGGRMSRGASPVPSPVDRPMTPERQPALNELVEMAMGQSPLAPPRPLFYDSFDLGDDNDKEEEEKKQPGSPLSRSPVMPPMAPLDRVETMDLSISRSASPHPSRPASPRPRKMSTSQAPDLSIETAASVSGSSIELVTPAFSHAPGRMSPTQSSSEALEHHRAMPRDIIATAASDRQDVYGQRLWRSPSEEALAHSLAEKAHRRNESLARDDRSETCPSTFGSQSWEAAIAAFPTIDDHFRNVPYYNNYVSDTGPGERESLASNTAVAPTDSCTHSQAEESPRKSRPEFNRAHSAGNEAPSDPNSTMWTSWRDVPRRLSGRSQSRGSSRGSSHDQRARIDEGGWDGDSDSSSESEEDDVALGSLHPGAAAAQQQRLAEQKKRREARRQARALRAAKKETELRRSKSSATSASRRREWNGEGVHPDALAGHLERVAVNSKAPPIPSRALRPPPSVRSDRSPLEAGTPLPLSRSTTLGRSNTSGHGGRSGASTSGHRIASEGDAQLHPRSREPQHRIVSEGDATRSAALSRATSISNSPASSTGMRRPRAHSSAGRMPLSVTPTEPTPVRRSVSVRCMVAQGADLRQCALDVYPETTARDVLMAARHRGDIGEGNWVVFESFVELGLERQVREHEVILSGVTRGWDSSEPRNAIVLREVPPHNIWTRNIPETPPMVSSWVHLETKPGKWTKTWLDVRGGQVFLSKNEKGKEEVHVSTLFSDVYTLRRAHNAPQSYTFVLKRLDAAASFQSPSEYIRYIAADESAGWKLHRAIFASRSFAMAQADPTVKTRLHPPSASLASSTSSSIGIGPHLAKHVNVQPSSPHRAPSSHSAMPQPPLSQASPRALHTSHSMHHHSSSRSAQPGRTTASGPGNTRPLVDLDADPTGFTGQGRLRRNPNYM